MPSRWFIGLTSGSSADGVDAVLLEVEGVGLNLKVRLAQTLHQPYGQDLRTLLFEVAGPGPCDARKMALLHRLLGETFAAAALRVADRASFSLQKVQCIGCTGHTVRHDPDGRFPSTLAVGMAAIVAERTGITTVHDFRNRDMAAGGQGVPLVALADYLLFRHPGENRVLLHLGGLTRLVFLPAGGRIQDIRGFDAGPCNIFLDGLMRQLSGGRESFDPGGKHAVQGRCLEPVLQRWLGHPYLSRRPPKSLPHHFFGEEFIAQIVDQARREKWNCHDLLCTANQFVTRAVVNAMRRFLPLQPPPGRVLLSGGGVRNGLLWHLLQQQLEGIPMERTDAVGVPAEARKAVSIGLLTALAVDGVPANVPAATGATGSRLLGSWTPGSALNWARCLAWMAAQTTTAVGATTANV
jgi:anhydro-N-acetylmuramic acid kinase